MTDSMMETIAKNIVSELLLDEEDWPLIVDAMKPIADSLAAMEADNAALLTKVRQCLTMTRSEAQLLAGEMTAGEWRTVSAILVNRIKVIDAMREGKG